MTKAYKFHSISDSDDANDDDKLFATLSTPGGNTVVLHGDDARMAPGNVIDRLTDFNWPGMELYRGDAKSAREELEALRRELISDPHGLRGALGPPGDDDSYYARSIEIAYEESPDRPERELYQYLTQAGRKLIDKLAELWYGGREVTATYVPQFLAEDVDKEIIQALKAFLSSADEHQKAELMSFLKERS